MTSTASPATTHHVDVDVTPMTVLATATLQDQVDHSGIDARIEGGGSSNDIEARFMPMIAGLEARYRDTQATLLLISHGGTLGAMLPLLLSNVDLAYPLDHPMGYTNPIVAELRDGEWVCLRWGNELLGGA